MSKINIITPPDILHSQATTFLLIQPSNDIRKQFQSLLEKWDKPINVYFYSPESEEETDILWLINACKIADYTIIDVDNLGVVERNFASYFISLPNTFYLTMDNIIPYNIISVNRIYNLDWLEEHLREEE